MTETQTQQIEIISGVDARYLRAGERFTAPAGAVVDGAAIDEPEVFVVDDRPIEHGGVVCVPVAYPDDTAGCVELGAGGFVALAA